MAERLNAAVLKTVVPIHRDRGFESHSLRHVARERRGAAIQIPETL